MKYVYSVHRLILLSVGESAQLTWHMWKSQLTFLTDVIMHICCQCWDKVCCLKGSAKISLQQCPKVSFCWLLANPDKSGQWPLNMCCVGYISCVILCIVITEVNCQYLNHTAVFFHVIFTFHCSEWDQFCSTVNDHWPLTSILSDIRLIASHICAIKQITWSHYTDLFQLLRLGTVNWEDDWADCWSSEAVLFSTTCNSSPIKDLCTKFILLCNCLLLLKG